MLSFLGLNGFEVHQYAWLGIGFLFFCFSILAYFRKKDKLALLSLTLCGASLFIFGALLDPYLNLWDEKFHALVALNTKDNFLFPKLYKEAIVPENNYLNWTSAHIWLHKQPLFIWQIALCFKIFGVSTFTLRIPSIIMATLAIPITHRIVSLLTDSQKGYFSAIAITFSWFLLNLVSGKGEIDHNDVCFFFYITTSLWAWIEYIHSGRQLKWIIIAAIFCGGAVLTKWLTGLLLYFVWSVYLLSEYKFNIKEWKINHFALAILITTILVVPWQIYTFVQFPEMAKVEHEYNFQHLHSPVEEHAHPTTFYLRTLPHIFFGFLSLSSISPIGPKQIITYIILFIGLITLVLSLKKYSHKITLLTTLIFVYLFFSLAKTKMVTYPFIVSLIWFASIGAFIDLIFRKVFVIIKNRKIYTIISGIFLLFSALYMLNIPRLRIFHTNHFYLHQAMKWNATVFTKLQDTLPEKCIVFNVATLDSNLPQLYIEASFYTQHDCYPIIPSQTTLEKLKQQGYSIAVFTQNPLPEEILNDPDIILIHDIYI